HHQRANDSPGARRQLLFQDGNSFGGIDFTFQLRQISQNLTCLLISGSSVFGEQLSDDRVEFYRHTQIKPAWRNWIVVQNGVENESIRYALKHRTACEHLVKNCAQ